MPVIQQPWCHHAGEEFACVFRDDAARSDAALCFVDSAAVTGSQVPGFSVLGFWFAGFAVRRVRGSDNGSGLL
jgi:hypothetical protein